MHLSLCQQHDRLLLRKIVELVLDIFLGIDVRKLEQCIDSVSSVDVFPYPNITRATLNIVCTNTIIPKLIRLLYFSNIYYFEMIVEIYHQIMDHEVQRF